MAYIPDPAEIDSECRFFTSFDAANGYYQIPLHPSIQHLTILMTPWGRYKFLRASMGLCSSGDEYNRQAGITFSKENFRFAKFRLSLVGYDIQHGEHH